MKSSEIRTQFLKFFERNGHTIVASSPLVPGNDPTLLFTNAGMVQFKDVFLGLDKRPYNRATTSQRCVRAGGKHNDLENVGYTARHHTFFEMLGNFSFGDYFKREAIHFAWELLTKDYGLAPERMWVTVYKDDDEAYEIWANDIKVPRERIARIGDKPGGREIPERQLLADGRHRPLRPLHGDLLGPRARYPGWAAGTPDADGDRYIEIWNLVFMQFNRDEAGTLHPLPKPSVDTGMGLERIAAVLQGVHSNYEIDLFQDLIRGAARVTGAKDLTSNSLKVIADHIRACSFLVVDGVIPGNEGRGYVLRRIIRRAIRHGYKLGQKKPFFHLLVDDLAKVMGEAYPELVREKSRVIGVLKQEEERFAETLEHGMEMLEGALHREDRMLDGSTVFKLYDTYRLPGRPHRGHRARARRCRSIWPASRPRCSSSASGRGPLPSSSMSARRGVQRQAHRVPRLRDAQARCHAWWRCTSMARPSIAWRAASAAWWSSTARRSMPSPAARWAIAACWCGMPRPSPASRWKTRRRSRPKCSATRAW